MSVATITGICVGLLVAVAALVRLGGWSVPEARAGRVLRWLAVAVTVGAAVAALPDAIDDSSPVPYLLAVPVVVALLALAVDVAGRAVVVLTGLVALAMAAVGLFFAMFLTPYFLVSALLLGFAAIASIRPADRREAHDVLSR